MTEQQSVLAFAALTAVGWFALRLGGGRGVGLALTALVLLAALARLL